MGKKGKAVASTPGVRTCWMNEKCGYVFCVENDSDAPFGIQVDSMDSIGFVSTIEGGACGCIDLVPARSRKVVIALALRLGAQRTALTFAFEALPPEAAAWAVRSAEDLHMPLPLTVLAKQSTPCKPDETVLKAEDRPVRRRRPLHARGGNHWVSPEEEQEDEEALAEALRLSMEGCVGDGTPKYVEGDDEEDLLAAAIRLSMHPASAPKGAV